jgi:hypothetical protein
MDLTAHRTLRRKPKARKRVQIPADLAWFLIGVYQLIVERDDRVRIPSDDLIQWKRVYGGLNSKGGSTYSFVYFPDKRGNRNKWYISLNRTGIASISRGKRKFLTLWACKTSGCNMKFSRSTDTCFYCDWVDAA